MDTPCGEHLPTSAKPVLGVRPNSDLCIPWIVSRALQKCLRASPPTGRLQHKMGLTWNRRLQKLRPLIRANEADTPIIASSGPKRRAMAPTWAASRYWQGMGRRDEARQGLRGAFAYLQAPARNLTGRHPAMAMLRSATVSRSRSCDESRSGMSDSHAADYAANAKFVQHLTAADESIK